MTFFFNSYNHYFQIYFIHLFIFFIFLYFMDLISFKNYFINHLYLNEIKFLIHLNLLNLKMIFFIGLKTFN
jgi:hypothetical protein